MAGSKRPLLLRLAGSGCEVKVFPESRYCVESEAIGMKSGRILRVCGRLMMTGALAGFVCHSGLAQQRRQFTCGETKGGDAATKLSGATRYAGGGAGFDLVASPTLFRGGSCASERPFFFSVAVPEGNYRVTVVLGSDKETKTTVRAESRRLMVDVRTVAAGGSAKEVFNVNVRTEDIEGVAGGAKVKLKPREVGALDWDEKLTLEFNGEHPGFQSLTIEPIVNVPTVYLAGDSTVVDQDKEPWAAWGQMLPVFFGTGVVIANEAESGETIRSFTAERRFDKVMSTIKRGDFLMIQFAHNDQKNGSPEATNFKGDLARYVEAVRKVGASPILVTSMNRRTFDADGKITDSLGGYPQAMREFAKEANVPLIDLNARSKTLFEAMGPQGTLKAFVHYPANTFPGQDLELKDDTHFNAYGAFELAKIVVEEIREQKLPLVKYLKKDVPRFDAARPDDVAKFVWAPSPMVSTEKPYGK